MVTSSCSSRAKSVCSVCRSSGEMIAILLFPLFLFMVPAMFNKYTGCLPSARHRFTNNSFYCLDYLLASIRSNSPRHMLVTTCHLYSVAPAAWDRPTREELGEKPQAYRPRSEERRVGKECR